MSADDVDEDSGGANDEVDPDRLALDRAQSMSRPIPRRRRRDDQEPHKPFRPPPDPLGQLGGFSSALPDDTDPKSVSELLQDLVQDHNWEHPLNEARVFADWPRIVGADVAAHCEPTALREGELRISAESTAWATQLRLLAGTLLARVVAEVGPDVVSRIVVTGPVGPSWKHGPRSVRGARGPRDTYG